MVSLCTVFQINQHQFMQFFYNKLIVYILTNTLRQKSSPQYPYVDYKQQLNREDIVNIAAAILAWSREHLTTKCARKHFAESAGNFRGKFDHTCEEFLYRDSSQITQRIVEFWLLSQLMLIFFSPLFHNLRGP